MHKVLNLTLNASFGCILGAYILHIQSTGTHCSFKMNQGAVGSEDNFGYYVSPNPKFRCTATDADTTQWWFGTAYPDFCHPNPCLNGGTCSNGKTNYTCTCPKGYTGDICQHTVIIYLISSTKITIIWKKKKMKIISRKCWGNIYSLPVMRSRAQNNSNVVTLNIL